MNFTLNPFSKIIKNRYLGFEKKAISILAGYLNSSLSYLITTESNWQMTRQTKIQKDLLFFSILPNKRSDFFFVSVD